MYNKTVEVSIVISAFNEESRIQNVLKRIDKKRNIPWGHLSQILLVIRQLLKSG
jgi:hypothetical protein